MTGGILTFANRMVGLTASAVSNALAGVYALVGHIHSWTEITGLGTAATNSAAAFATAAQGAAADTALQPAATNGFVTAAITNGLGGSGITANDVTNSLDLSVAPSLTGTVAKAAGALQGGETNALLDLAGTRAMTGNSVTLARDVKARDAGTVGEYGANFGEVNTVGGYGFGAGWLNNVGDWGFGAGGNNSVGNYGFGAGIANSVGNYGFGAGSHNTVGGYGYGFGAGWQNIIGGYGFGAGSQNNVGDYGFGAGIANTVGTFGFGAGFANTVGGYGFGVGRRGKGAEGSFVFSDSTDADFDRLAYTNWFSVRASGGTYFATPDLTVTGTVTAASYSGSGADAFATAAQGALADTALQPTATNGFLKAGDVTNSLDLSVAPSLTGTVAQAASALQPVTTNNFVQLWNTNYVTGGRDWNANLELWGNLENTDFSPGIVFHTLTKPYTNWLGFYQNSLIRMQASQNMDSGGGWWNLVYHTILDDANFVAGVNYLAPNGDASGLTGLTAGQVAAAGGLTNLPNATIPTAQGNLSGEVTFDFTAGGVQSGVQTGAVTNVTFTVSSTNAESALVYQFFSNGDSVTWNTNTTTFVGGTAPTLTSNEWNRLFISGYRGRYHVGAAGSAP